VKPQTVVMHCFVVLLKSIFMLYCFIFLFFCVVLYFRFFFQCFEVFAGLVTADCREVICKLYFVLLPPNSDSRIASGKFKQSSVVSFKLVGPAVQVVDIPVNHM